MKSHVEERARKVAQLKNKLFGQILVFSTIWILYLAEKIHIMFPTWEVLQLHLG